MRGACTSVRHAQVVFLAFVPKDTSSREFQGPIASPTPPHHHGLIRRLRAARLPQAHEQSATPSFRARRAAQGRDRADTVLAPLNVHSPLRAHATRLRAHTCAQASRRCSAARLCAYAAPRHSQSACDFEIRVGCVGNFLIRAVASRCAASSSSVFAASFSLSSAL